MQLFKNELNRNYPWATANPEINFLKRGKIGGVVQSKSSELAVHVELSN